MQHKGTSASLDAESRTRELEQALAEKEHALKELQHRAKNSLQLVISLLKLQVNRIRDMEARAAYDQTLQRIESLAVLYRQLHASQDETRVDLGTYLRELCEVAAENTAPGQRVETDLATDIRVGLHVAMPVGLIAIELISNSLRHVFPSEGWIRISLLQSGPDTATLQVEDNGKPLPNGFDNESDSSLILVDALAAQLGAHADVEADRGRTSTTLSISI